MKILHTSKIEELELPMQLKISFENVYMMYKKYASTAQEKHPYHGAAKNIIAEFKKHPILREGFTDTSLLDTYSEQIEKILDPLFPEALQLNEIKAASIPFSFTSFKFSERFRNIIDNAGDSYELSVRNFEDNLFYIHACTMILHQMYGYEVDLKRPFFFDIPNEKTGTLKHYRAAFNGDFGKIEPTKDAPKISLEDYHLLLNNFDNVAIWKEKFPPNSYVFKGFGIINLFDVTTDEIISDIRTNLLRSDENLILDLQDNIRKFYNIPDLKLGYSIFDNFNTKICETATNKSNSIVLHKQSEIACNNYFCESIMKTVFQKKEAIAISDVKNYGINTNENSFFKNLSSQGIQSIALIPIKATGNNDLALLEIASPRPYELNSVNLNKLKDIIPVFEVAVKRASEEYQNVLEATIQEHYTSIHPAVKWRFNTAANNYQNQLLQNVENPSLDAIVFQDVYPLFGQTDIKGSSIARNTAIQQDLTTQLNLAIDILNQAFSQHKLPIYEELIFRVTSYLSNLTKGLKAGDEIGMIDFLKRDIYPVFNHLKEGESVANKQITAYIDRLDPKLQVIYEKRKDYENSVTLLNDSLSALLDQKQEEAQEMFPHYFERYKTDGIEFNMYIGQALVQNKRFDELYLYNLRLWQLQVMYELENLAHQARTEMRHDLRVASLILVHSTPLSIQFRMDEKQFDVDGAYNIRYEIIKKRIDKAHLKGTKKRLTSPGKIAIVYSQDKDAREYLKYITFLQSKKMLGSYELVEIEDLQGVSGLKAIRVDLVYNKNYHQDERISFEDLVKEISS
ncbi:hypothetical protein GCM10011416_04470 [Polaribacter pacificus]|uniref:GAF domain-containing protein n=1 Tax=Polaribacter pacificus TaxID=1775173 RepID=A0A917HUE5_9FLAO|nr:GAF domain-containing protein [Polaribacter pacificus]GGG91046.1 hypothetical protein GCM10011416_04470 [Polaribacter pacificus]